MLRNGGALLGIYLKAGLGRPKPPRGLEKSMQEHLLFENYEIKGIEFGPRLYKIIGVSVLLNVLFLYVGTQGSLLTRKGCESPLVSEVCSVLDAVYLGSIIISTETEYVDEDYEKTELQDAEITWVDVTGDAPLKYPDGYFALSNPELQNPVPGIPGDLSAVPITPAPTEVNPATAPATLPTPNPNAVADLPNSPFGGDTAPPSNPISRKTRRNKPSADSNTNAANPKPEANAEVKPEDLVKDPVTGVDINKRPLKDFADVVKTLVEGQQLDLDKPFVVVAEAVLLDNGRLDVSIDKKTKEPKSRVIRAEGDEQMIEIAKQAIAAVGDSGWLVYLKTQGIDKITYQVMQDNDQVQVLITSDQPTPERANTITSGLRGAIEAALLLDQNNIKKLGEDEKILLRGASPMANGKQFVLNFSLPKPVAKEMINRRLRDMTVEPKPNSTIPSRDGMTSGK